MKNGIGCLMLIIALVFLSIIGSNTGHYGGGGGIITFIIFTLAFIGWKLISSKKTTSSNDRSPKNKQTHTTKVDNTIDTHIVNKEEEQSSSAQPNTNPEKINVEVSQEKKQSSDYTQLSEIEKIERQYEKGIFSEEEKQKLINNILDKKQNEEIEKIKSSYATVLNEYRDKLNQNYNEESAELVDLQQQGIIDEKILTDKLSLLKINIAKRIQKEIKFKCILGFEVFQGLGVKKINSSFLDDSDEISGNVIEIVNSKEVRVKWDSNSLSPPISLTKLSVTGVNNDILNDWELSDEDFLLKSDIEYYGLNLKIGDEYKGGIVFYMSDTEINVFKRFENSPLKSLRSDDYIMSNYNSLKSREDSFWQIPNVDVVNKFISFCIEYDRFIPVAKRIWTSETIDFTSIKCVELWESNDNIKTSEIDSSKALTLYGILVHKTELKS